jgi:hypothetical protein
MIRQFVIAASLLTLATAETARTPEFRSTYGAGFPAYGASRAWENQTPMMSSAPASAADSSRTAATPHRRMTKD